MDFFPDGSGRFAQRLWPLCSYVLIIYSGPPCHIQGENLLLVWPAQILIFFLFSHLLCLLLCLYFTWLSLLNPCALLLPCLLPRGHHPLKAFPILFAVTDFQLVGLIPVRIPWSSLRTAWPCPGSWSTTRSHHQQVLLKCHHCHPPGTMGGWSLLSEVAPHFKLFSRFSRPYGSHAASGDWKRSGLFKGLKGKGVGRWNPRCQSQVGVWGCGG